MEREKCSLVLLVGGGLLMGAALVWWASFYGQVIKGWGGTLGDAFPCLYSSGGPCGFVRGWAGFGGATPYNPVIFWIGVAVLAVGVILKLSATAPPGVSTSLSTTAGMALSQAMCQATGAELDLGQVTKKCPACAEQIKVEALVCRFCGHKFSDAEVRDQIEAVKAEHARVAQAQEELSWSSMSDAWRKSIREKRCPRCPGTQPLGRSGDNYVCASCGMRYPLPEYN